LNELRDAFREAQLKQYVTASDYAPIATIAPIAPLAPTIR
jgi:hypothetical protein